MDRDNNNGCIFIVILVIVGIYQWLRSNTAIVAVVAAIILVLAIFNYTSEQEKKEEEKKIREERERSLEAARNFYRTHAYEFKDTINKYKGYGLGISGMYLFSELTLRTCDTILNLYRNGEEMNIINYEKYIRKRDFEEITMSSFDFPLELGMEFYYKHGVYSKDILKKQVENFLLQNYYDNIENEEPLSISEEYVLDVLIFTNTKKLEDLYFIWVRNQELIEKVMMKRQLDNPNFENKVIKELERFEYMTREEILREATVYYNLVKEGHKKRDIVKEYAYSKINEIKDDIY